MTMHREQVGSIRDELDRVQQLTRELEQLQAKLGDASNTEKGDATARGERGRQESAPRRAVTGKKERHSLDPTSASRSERREHRMSADSAVNRETANPVASQNSDRESRLGGQAPPVDTADFHAQITKRIAELQRERQGYWRRILNVMSVSAD